MGMYKNTGESLGNDATSQATTDIAILLDERTCRYGNGYATFRLQSTTGLQPNTPIITEQILDLSNLMNADQSFVSGRVTKAACVKLKLPREIRRSFKTKFIPPGSMFIVEFSNNVFTKPVIIARKDDESACVEVGGKLNETPVNSVL